MNTQGEFLSTHRGTSCQNKGGHPVNTQGTSCQQQDIPLCVDRMSLCADKMSPVCWQDVPCVLIRCPLGVDMMFPLCVDRMVPLCVDRMSPFVLIGGLLCVDRMSTVC